MGNSNVLKGAEKCPEIRKRSFFKMAAPRAEVGSGHPDNDGSELKFRLERQSVTGLNNIFSVHLEV